MTASSNSYYHTLTPEYIAALAAEVERNPTDLVQKILLANALEQTGEISASVALYQEVIEQDKNGNYSLIAHKALENLASSGAPKLGSPDTNSIEPIPISNQTIAHQRFKSIFPQISQSWRNLNFRNKLAILLVASTAIPIIIVTQGIIAVTKESLYLKFKQSLQQEGTNFVQEYVLWDVDESRNEADTIAQFVQATKINLSNPQQMAAWRQILQNYIANFRVSQESNSVEKNIRVLTDAQGRTVAQYIQTLAPESFNPRSDQLQLAPRYRRVSLPLGIYLGDVPIVKNALQTGEELSGMELLNSDVIKRLGQDEQANIGFPPVTRKINQDKALVAMVVRPIKIGNKLVGTVMIGAVENRNFLTTDAFKSRVNVPFSTIFAQERRISSNIPVSNRRRDIGTFAPPHVVETVLKQGKELIEPIKIGQVDYLGIYQPLYDHQQELNPKTAKPVGMGFIAQPLSEFNGLLAQQLRTAYTIGLAMTLIAALVAILIARSFARPLKHLADFASGVGSGEGIRLEDTQRQDEIGILARSLNQMAANIETNLLAIRHQEAQVRQEKERLQQGMVNLLLDTETVKQGDLTVRAKVDRGETGAIADALNMVISSLRSLVIQVQNAANKVQTEAIETEQGVEKLSGEATNQAALVAQTLGCVAQMEQSIIAIAQSAQTAAAIARSALKSAQYGDQTMDQTVDSIEMVRVSVSETTKKAKRLAQSAQEISKIVTLISEISEKTNILAFNAAIEASKAGEHGKGFRLVANEVRRLAERVTESTREIEPLVNTIGQATADVLKTMEVSNTQVVTGTSLVTKTKQTLQSLAVVSQEIDFLLQSISASTESQAENSKMVNSSIQTVSAIAQTTKLESQAVLSAMQELLLVAQELQNSVSRFRV